MHIVAVTACPIGIAHTYMAAEKLEKVAKELGHTIKVETQGAMGIENELTPADIAQADVVILATDIAIEKASRFAGIKKVEIPVQRVLKDPKAVFLDQGSSPEIGDVPVLEHSFSCPLIRGMHARPASLLQALAQQYQSRITLDNLRTHKTANVRSVFSLVGARSIGDDPCRLRVDGPDQDQAFQALRGLHRSRVTPQRRCTGRWESRHPGPGPALFTEDRRPDLPDRHARGQGPGLGDPLRGPDLALAHASRRRPGGRSVCRDGEVRPRPAGPGGPGSKAGSDPAAASVEAQILAAHLGMLHDEEFIERIHHSISHQGCSPAQAILDAARTLRTDAAEF